MRMISQSTQTMTSFYQGTYLYHLGTCSWYNSDPQIPECFTALEMNVCGQDGQRGSAKAPPSSTTSSSNCTDTGEQSQRSTLSSH